MSKTVQYTDDEAGAPVGYDLFTPGEERVVTDEQAAYLTGNVHFKEMQDTPTVDAPAAAAPTTESAPPAPAGPGPEAARGLIVATAPPAPQSGPAQGGN